MEQEKEQNFSMIFCDIDPWQNDKFRKIWKVEITDMLQGEQKNQVCWKNTTEAEAARG